MALMSRVEETARRARFCVLCENEMMTSLPVLAGVLFWCVNEIRIDFKSLQSFVAIVRGKFRVRVAQLHPGWPAGR